MAFIKKQTVFELILKSIYLSYMKFAKLKIEKYDDDSDLHLLEKQQQMAFQ